MVTMVTGKLQILKYLIVEVGADPVARDNDGLTTLHAATQGGHLDVVRVSVSTLPLCICMQYSRNATSHSLGYLSKTGYSKLAL